MNATSQDLRKTISAALIRGEGEWVSGIRIMPDSTVNGTIVSQQFENHAPKARREIVENLLRQTDPLLRIGFLSLLTIDESQDLELVEYTDKPIELSETWLGFASALASGDAIPPKADTNAFPRVVTFYSYKGGVGRTTAITHVAYELARSGKKVVLVDLDLEAPGLNQSFDLPKVPTVGILEYFYRTRLGMAKEQTPAITDTFCEARFRSDVRGRLFVVLAGQLCIH